MRAIHVFVGNDDSSSPAMPFVCGGWEPTLMVELVSVSIQQKVNYG